MSILTGTKLYSILHNVCPRCHKGKFWYTGNPYTSLFKYNGNMPKKCDRCELIYEQEPGYWYGAMYVSYALGVAIFVAAWIATIVLLPEDSSMLAGILIIAGSLILLAPVNYYLSRLIWINFFIRHSKKLSSSVIEQKTKKSI